MTERVYICVDCGRPATYAACQANPGGLHRIEPSQSDSATETHSGMPDIYVRPGDPRKSSDASSNRAQAQDSLTDQVMRVWKLALEYGEHDAADWIRRTFDADAIPNREAKPHPYVAQQRHRQEQEAEQNAQLWEAQRQAGRATPNSAAIREQLLDDMAKVVLALQFAIEHTPDGHEAFQRILKLIPNEIRQADE